MAKNANRLVVRSADETVNMIRRGFLHWVHLDKRRPALVISPDYRNQWASDLIVLPCSSRMRVGPTLVALKKGEAGLLSPSVIHCEQPITLRKAEVEERALGESLSPRRLAEAERALLRAVGVLLE